MMINERIKERRKYLNMSQEELAKKVGYKDKTAINKIELGINGLSCDKLLIFANCLKTSQSYLLGIIDNPNISDKQINYLLKDKK